MTRAVSQRHGSDLLLQGAVLRPDRVHGLAIENRIALRAVLRDCRLHLLQPGFFLDDALLGRENLCIELTGGQVADKLAIILLQAVFATEIGHPLFSRSNILAHFLKPLPEIVDDTLAAVGGRLEQLGLKRLHDGL